MMDGNSLAAQVADLEERYKHALDLLGHVLATLRLERNQSGLAESSAGRELNAISEKWWRQFQGMVGLNPGIPETSPEKP